MELSSLFKKTAPVVVNYDGDTINTQVYTDRLTPQRKAALLTLAAEDNEEQKDETVMLLSELIERWDVTLDGQPYLPTYENLMQVSYPLISTLLREITSFLGERANPTKPQTN